MRYTKAQRHQIYRKALSFAKSDGWPFGLCHWIYSGGATIAFNLNDFPEVIKMKPKHQYSYIRWFKPSNKNTRLAILRRAIRQTKPKSKKTE